MQPEVCETPFVVVDRKRRWTRGEESIEVVDSKDAVEAREKLGTIADL